jgi:hypothetical protein
MRHFLLAIVGQPVEFALAAENSTIVVGTARHFIDRN